MPAFRKELIIRGSSGLVFALGIFILFWKWQVDDYLHGLLLGMGLGAGLVSGYFLYVASQEKQLAKAYVSAFDERNREISRLSATIVLTLGVVLVMGLLLAEAFLSFSLPYRSLLIGQLYFLLLAYVLLKAVLQRMI